MTCPVLPPIPNGIVIATGFSVGSTATYSCNLGQMLFGSTTRQCLADGSWSGQMPFCKPTAQIRVVCRYTQHGSLLHTSCSSNVAIRQYYCQIDEMEKFACKLLAL